MRVWRLPSASLAALAALALTTSSARGQDPPQLPPPSPPPSPSPSPGEQGAPAEPIPPPPPPVVYTPAPAPTHAPHTALWLGARLGLLGYGGSFFVNDRNKEETSGNLVGNGAALEANIGARLVKRYLPYVLVEYAVLRPGHRFDADAEASSSLLGLGFRFVIGRVDRAGLMADLSLAQRTIEIRRGGQRYRMHGPEIFRLGLGAEIRLSTLFTLSPLLHLSGGSMQRSDGDVAYAPNQGDGSTKPTYLDGTISRSQRSYLVIGLGCGAHFDLFGK